MDTEVGNRIEAPGQALPEPVRELLRRRGIIDADATEAFLYPDYQRHLGDPFTMVDMEPAVRRIQQAIAANETVGIYGDYDIDGVVSTALMLEVLQQYGLEPLTYIPDRYQEGYGLHVSALEQLKDQGASLIITVDCGITGAAEARWVSEQGLDLIITDHHELPEELPVAVAVINPKRSEDAYPFKDLAGVGVAFTLARALQQRLGRPASGQEKWLLDLVALGTVCDVMPLTGENRVLVKFGLVVLQKTRRVGLVALAQSADIDLSDINTYHLGFRFGPRLNAAGRLEHANFSLELITTKDPLDAQALAFQLEELNHRRQLEQSRIVAEASALAAAYTADPVLVLADPGWPHGVVGIVASKLAETWQKPTLVLQTLGDQAKGSGRSFGEYSLISALRANANLFTRLGGHDFAAGFSLPVSNLEALRAALVQHHRATVTAAPTDAGQPEAEIIIDEHNQLGWELYQALEQLEPFGSGNPQPLLMVPKLKILDVDTVGSRKDHLKLKLANPAGGIYEAIGFGLVEKYPALRSGQTVDVLCYLQKRTWNGRDSLQLVIAAIH
jgi:single-stranded-DNA-specific exonuclease